MFIYLEGSLRKLDLGHHKYLDLHPDKESLHKWPLITNVINIILKATKELIQTIHISDPYAPKTT